MVLKVVLGLRAQKFTPILTPRPELEGVQSKCFCGCTKERVHSSKQWNALKWYCTHAVLEKIVCNFVIHMCRVPQMIINLVNKNCNNVTK